MKYLLLIFLICTGTALANVYKWADKSGKVHFSDKPHEDEKSEKIILKVNPPKVTDSATLKQVKMYATSWCGYCKKARMYFRQENISYTEYDIESDAQAKKDYDTFGGRGVPVIFVGQERMNGFDESRFKELYH